MPLFTRPPALLRHAAVLLTLTYLYGCASRSDTEDLATCAQAGYPLYDPTQPLVPSTFVFNEVIDQQPSAPLAHGYGYTPQFFQLGTPNFTPHANAPTVYHVEPSPKPSPAS